MTIDLARFAALVPQDHGLCVVASVREDGSPHASVVNAGVLPHPRTGADVVAFVSAGPVKRSHLRADPRIAVTARAGWQWATVEGTAELLGPDDPWADVDAEQLRLLLRAVFVAAGGTHDDWEGYDRAMAEERRTIVLVTPDRTYGVP
jgi:PPOX class probable F420-dependent enzyme